MTSEFKTYPKLSIVNEPVVYVIDPWKLVATEKKVVLEPLPVPWRGIPIICCLFIAFCGLLYVPVWVWGEPESRGGIAILFAAFAAFNCILISTLVYHSYRWAQKNGPPILIDLIDNTFSVAQHQLCVPLDQVAYLEVRNDMPDDQGNYRFEDGTSELILVVRGEEGPKRYPLIDCSTSEHYDALAREIAQLKIVPVKRVKGVRGSKLVYEKWLTPQPDHEAEMTGDHP
ncbi:hypothetical protein C5Y96_10660 [Blastopirellula marina]|uniref:Uncharacterized protein n=1 Tax=Blastopirellula marina TaxID=124 RepID=A0A2S8FN80_9BACT|nr:MULTISPECIES: hypothetical protein [Pirellulaceae]PQO33304.1 hypothetical protein C5Y96_10660 [Blastopirellula marina]RCS52393.1 hypothetical protein DTL36_10670 [Bremerella cremea]